MSIINNGRLQSWESIHALMEQRSDIPSSSSQNARSTRSRAFALLIDVAAGGLDLPAGQLFCWLWLGCACVMLAFVGLTASAPRACPRVPRQALDRYLIDTAKT